MASVARITDIRGLVSLNDGEEILKEKDPVSENGGILTISDFARIIFDDGREIEIQGPVQLTLNENFFQTGEFDIQNVQIENLNLVRDTVENLVTNIEGGTLPENPSEAFVATEQLDTLLENDEVISSTRSVEDDFAPTEAPEAPTEAPEAPTEAPEAPTEAPEAPTEAPEAPIPDTPTTDEPETTVDVTFPDTDEQTTDEVAEDTIPEETVDIPESTVDAVEEDTIAAIPEQTTPETVVVEAVDEQTTPETVVVEAVDEQTTSAVDEQTVSEDTTDGYTIKNSDSNLNQNGDTTTFNFDSDVNSVEVGIKSFKVGKDSGEIVLFKDGVEVGRIQIEDIYDDKGNQDTTISVESDIAFDSISISHDGESKGNGKNSQEFKIGDVVVDEDTIPEIVIVEAVDEQTTPAVDEQTTPETVVVEAVDEQTTPETVVIEAVDEQTTPAVDEQTTPETVLVEAVDEQTTPETVVVEAVDEQTTPETVVVEAVDEQTTPETVVVEAVDEQTTPAVDESTVDASENTVDESVVTEYKPEETTSVSVPPSVVVTTTLLTTVATAGEFTTVFEAESSEGEDVFSLKFDENGTTLVATNHLTNEEVSYDMTNELQNGQSHEIGMNISEFGMSIVVNGSDVASLEFNQVIDMPTSLTVTEAPNLEQEGIYISGLDADIIPAVMNSSEDAFASFEDIVLDLELASIKEPESLSSDLLSSNSELNLSDMVGDESDNIDLSNIVSSQPKEESEESSSNNSASNDKPESKEESPFDILNNKGV